LLILTINSGSSSIKYSIFDTNSQTIILSGIVERIGSSKSSFIQFKSEKNVKEEIIAPDHSKAMKWILEYLRSSTEINFKILALNGAVVHRVVHGGEDFSDPVLIDKKVEDKIGDLIGFAPLHNPANLEGIRSCKDLLPKIPHIAVFDTGFHNTIPEKAFLYAIPAEWYDKRKIRRYGFHGTSVEYVARRTTEILGEKDSRKLIILHLGNGSSITAVNKGKSIDTSMGFTPLEGLIMGTRSGDIDPGIIITMLREEKLTIDKIDTLLNKESGFIGITNRYRDMRDLVSASKRGEKEAKLALDMAAYRIQKYIGAYFTVLRGSDAIVFTAGIGENSSHFRSLILDGLSVLGVSYDYQANNKTINNREAIISTPESRIQILIIPTNEEIMMAQKAETLLKNKDQGK
jgi:acetate kinase